MQKWAFLLTLLFSLKGYAMNILISYFDPFDGKEENNSKNMAMLVKNKLAGVGVNVHTCELRTVFDKAFFELEDCINSLKVRPDMVISLGEAGCQKVRLETRGINNDKSRGADNDGVERDNTPIIPGGEKYLGVRMPLEQAYCKLSEETRKSFEISQSAGSFVCNNTLYHALDKLDLPYTFIHVPTMSCTSEEKNQKLSTDLASYLNAMVQLENLTQGPQPKTKKEVKAKLQTELSACEHSFYKQLKKAY